MRAYHFIITVSFSDERGISGSKTLAATINVPTGTKRHEAFELCISHAKENVPITGPFAVTYFSFEPNELD